MNHDEAVREMIEAGRRLDGLGFVPATDGNLSVRLSPREIVATVSGVRKGALTPRDFAVIDPDGNPLRGGAKASSEILMHLRIYRERADVAAVVHAHPPTATGFAVAGIPLQQCVLPEVVATIGAVPLVPYATPSTAELPEAITPLLKEYDALLLANHGVVTFGPTLFQAANRMEMVEQFARILFVARTLGQVNLLTPDQVERLNEIRHRYGFEGRAPACETCRNFAPPAPASGAPAPPPPGAPPAAPSPGNLADRVLQEVLRQLQARGR
jgi:L-fuculose-phosphate aldolase